jgi:hypothetical protein
MRERNTPEATLILKLDWRIGGQEEVDLVWLEGCEVPLMLDEERSRDLEVAKLTGGRFRFANDMDELTGAHRRPGNLYPPCLLLGP